MLHPGKVGIARRGHSVRPALIFLQQFTAPITVIKRGIGQNIISFEVRIAVIVEGVAMGNLRVNPPDGKVHLGEPPGGVI